MKTRARFERRRAGGGLSVGAGLVEIESREAGEVGLVEVGAVDAGGGFDARVDRADAGQGERGGAAAAEDVADDVHFQVLAGRDVHVKIKARELAVDAGVVGHAAEGARADGLGEALAVVEGEGLVGGGAFGEDRVLLEPEVALGDERVEGDLLWRHEGRGGVPAPAGREDGGEGLGAGCVRRHAVSSVCVVLSVGMFYVIARSRVFPWARICVIFRFLVCERLICVDLIFAF